MKPEDTTAAATPPFEQGVGRLESERADVGDMVATDVRQPRPETLRLTLDTQASVDLFNALPPEARRGWRLEKRVSPPPATVNRYCRAGMCVETDAEHEPWCERNKTPNDRVQARP